MKGSVSFFMIISAAFLTVSGVARAGPDWASMQQEMNALEKQSAWLGKVALLERAGELANQGNLVARVALCGAYLDEDSPFHDPRVGAVLARDVARELQEWADQGDPEAQCYLADFYDEGWGVAQDEERAVDLMRRAADAGLAKAQVDLCRRYLYGEGVEEDPDEAERYLDLVLSSLDPEACFAVAFAYGDPYLSIRVKDKQKALHAYEMAAQYGHAFSASILEDLYRKGEQVPQDTAKADSWRRKAAELGWSGAAYELAEEAVEQENFELAVRWFKVAAENGWALACEKLAEIYEAGQGIEADPFEAGQWREKAETLRRVEALEREPEKDRVSEEPIESDAEPEPPSLEDKGFPAMPD